MTLNFLIILLICLFSAWIIYYFFFKKEEKQIKKEIKEDEQYFFKYAFNTLLFPKEKAISYARARVFLQKNDLFSKKFAFYIHDQKFSVEKAKIYTEFLLKTEFPEEKMNFFIEAALNLNYRKLEKEELLKNGCIKQEFSYEKALIYAKARYDLKYNKNKAILYTFATFDLKYSKETDIKDWIFFASEYNLQNDLHAQYHKELLNFSYSYNYKEFQFYVKLRKKFNFNIQDAKAKIIKERKIS